MKKLTWILIIISIAIALIIILLIFSFLPKKDPALITFNENVQDKYEGSRLTTVSESEVRINNSQLPFQSENLKSNSTIVYARLPDKNLYIAVHPSKNFEKRDIFLYVFDKDLSFVNKIPLPKNTWFINIDWIGNKIYLYLITKEDSDIEKEIFIVDPSSGELTKLKEIGGFDSNEEKFFEIFLLQKEGSEGVFALHYCTKEEKFDPVRGCAEYAVAISNGKYIKEILRTRTGGRAIRWGWEEDALFIVEYETIRSTKDNYDYVLNEGSVLAQYFLYDDKKAYLVNLNGIKWE